jgi:hypothetical protein
VEKRPSKRLSIAYAVVAVLMALTMFISASGKLTLNPGAVKVIHDVVGVPLRFFPVLAALEIAGGLGLLAGIFRPKLGAAAGVGLVLYFVGAFMAHVIAGDWAGLTAPIVPFIMAVAALTLRLKSMPRA